MAVVGIAIIIGINKVTKLRTIILEDEMIEIHHNENLKNRPYLVRIFSYYDYGGPVEFRMDESDLQKFLSSSVDV